MTILKKTPGQKFAAAVTILDQTLEAVKEAVIALTDERYGLEDKLQATATAEDQARQIQKNLSALLCK